VQPAHPVNRLRRTIFLDTLDALESIARGGEIMDLAYKCDVPFGMNPGFGDSKTT
jgi:hypothetical protein